MVVFRAPRGWGKTTTAAAWLAALDDDHHYAWLTVPHRLSEQHFWDLLFKSLEPLAIPPRDLDDSSLTSAGLGDGSHLWLAIDNLHLVESAAVDDALVKITATNSHVHVITSTHAERPIETLAPIEADGLVYGPPQLRLTATEVCAIATILGVKIELNAARVIAYEVGGWPALVRSALLYWDGHQPLSGEARHHITQYLKLVATEAAPESSVHDAMRLSLARSEAEAGWIASGHGVAATHPSERRRGDGLASLDGQFPATMRAAWSGAFADSDPEAFQLLHTRLTLWHERNRRFERALEHAAESADATLCRRLLHEHWLTLAHHPDLARKLLGVVWRSDTLDDPRLAILGSHVGLDHHASVQSESQLAASVRAQVRWSLARLGTLDFSAHAEASLLAARRDATEIEDVELGDSVAGALSLFYAVIGATADAENWLRTARSRGSSDPHRLASRIVSLDTLNFVAAEWDAPTLEQAGHVAPDMVPPWLVQLEAALIAAGRLHQSAERPGVVATLTHQLSNIPPEQEFRLLTVLIVKVLATTLIAEEQFARCNELLTKMLPDHPALRATRARLALYCGDTTVALVQSRPSQDSDDVVSPRDVVECALVRASALTRLHRLDAAVIELEGAVALARTHSLVRPFLMVPRKDLTRMADLAPSLRPFLQLEDLARFGDALAPPCPTAELTDGEMRILGALSSGVAVASVASQLYISVNTAKSQLRSLYRKLRVHNRAQAVIRAKELRLLREDRSAPSITTKVL